MPETGVDKGQELLGWAEIVVKKWKDAVVFYKIHEGGLEHSQLFNSMNSMMIDAGADEDKIEFIIFLYSKFVDMGVGKEFSKGNSGDIESTFERKPKPWYSSVFFWQVHVLQELLEKKYNYEGGSLVFALLSAGDPQYAENRETVRNRTMKNYHKNRAKPGRWNSNKKWKPNK